MQDTAKPHNGRHAAEHHSTTVTVTERDESRSFLKTCKAKVGEEARSENEKYVKVADKVNAMGFHQFCGLCSSSGIELFVRGSDTIRTNIRITKRLP